MSNSIKAGLFHVIEGAVAITRSKGVFKQTKVYQRNGLIYCQHGGGYIRISKTGTSNPNVYVDGLEIPDGFGYTKLGYMCEPSHPEKAFNEKGERL